MAATSNIKSAARSFLPSTRSTQQLVAARAALSPMSSHLDAGCYVDDALGQMSDPILAPIAQGYTFVISKIYPYQKLDSTSFRLLRLHPKSSCIDIHQKPRKGSYLQGTIVEHKLDDDIPYECLSYVWGSSEAATIIFLNGGVLTLTANLELALRTIQHDELDRLIWIDAICINQQDPEERRQQVQIMRTIFLGAEQVIAFLGEDADGSERAPTILKEIRDGCDKFETIVPFDKIELSKNRIYGFEKVGLPPFHDDSWRVVMAFLSRPWFVRVWIIQEAVVARNLQITCGSWTMSGSEIFETLVMAFEHGLPILEHSGLVITNKAPATDAAQ